MKKYDAIVVGTGCGSIIADEAVAHGLKVALIDRGLLLGGTCLNLGCVPSKMLIFAAERVVKAQEAAKLGVHVEIKAIDFPAIMERMRHSRHEAESEIREGLLKAKDMDFYYGEAHFVEEYTLEVNGEKITGDKIFLASGSRPLIPPIKGLDTVSYLNNESVLELKDKPESLVIIGGGYIGVEYGHFFASVGTRVTIIEMADRLLNVKEPEISEVIKRKLAERTTILTGMSVEEVKGGKDSVSVFVKDSAGNMREITAEKVMVAVGRRSNADILKVENTGVETDKRGFIKVNEHMETNHKNIYAVGDATGQYMFTHVANREAQLVGHNVLHKAQLKMDFSASPHAVYSHPQIASVGMTEAMARQNHEILVSRTRYLQVAQGDAMMESEGFAKAVVDKKTSRILGFHIIGSYAPLIIQEVTNAMVSGGHVAEIAQAMHIHPALNELIPSTLNNLQ